MTLSNLEGRQRKGKKLTHKISLISLEVTSRLITLIAETDNYIYLGDRIEDFICDFNRLMNSLYEPFFWNVGTSFEGSSARCYYFMKYPYFILRLHSEVTLFPTIASDEPRSPMRPQQLMSTTERRLDRDRGAEAAAKLTPTLFDEKSENVLSCYCILLRLWTKHVSL